MSKLPTPIEIPYLEKLRLSDGDYVSVSTTGRIGISQNLVERFNITPNSRARLYWNENSNTIIAAFQAEEGYPIRLISGAPRYISAAHFFKKIRQMPIEHPKRYRYQVADAQETGLEDFQGKVITFQIDLRTDELHAGPEQAVAAIN